jgi:hypothetical protein
MSKAALISEILEMEPSLEYNGLSRDVVANLEMLYKLLSNRQQPNLF